MAAECDPREPGGHAEKVRLGSQTFTEEEPKILPYSSKSLPGCLTRVPWLLLLLLISLGLCFVLLVTTLVRVSRTDPCPQGESRDHQRNTSLDAVSHDWIQSGLEEIRQRLTQINASLAGLCRPCPWTWEPFQRSCYLFSRTLGSWEASVSSCQALGAHLVIVNSVEEQRFLRYWDIRKDYRTWIGLSDKHNEASWHWVDSTPLQLSFWRSGEPNNAGDEDCAELFEDGWNDNKCTAQNFWICEQPLVPCPGL